jgi:hypothetical protein
VFLLEQERIAMRVTDNRYAGEIEKFDLAIRMIGHEARTGTIRVCTGFTEDRIRKLYSTYFKAGDGTSGDGQRIKRKRGKSPRQITRFVSSTRRQVEATVLACLYLFCGVFYLDPEGRASREHRGDGIELGSRLCQAYEAYLRLYPDPQLSFEWAWSLYHAFIESRELYFAWCENCGGPYAQDAYALDYQRCPLCEIKDLGAQSNAQGR